MRYLLRYIDLRRKFIRKEKLQRVPKCQVGAQNWVQRLSSTKQVTFSWHKGSSANGRQLLQYKQFSVQKTLPHLVEKTQPIRWLPVLFFFLLFLAAQGTKLLQLIEAGKMHILVWIRGKMEWSLTGMAMGHPQNCCYKAPSPQHSSCSTSSFQL